MSSNIPDYQTLLSNDFLLSYDHSSPNCTEKLSPHLEILDLNQSTDISVMNDLPKLSSVTSKLKPVEINVSPITLPAVYAPKCKSVSKEYIILENDDVIYS